MTTILMVLATAVLRMPPSLTGHGREHSRRIDLARANILPGRSLIGRIAVFLRAPLTHADREFG